MYILHPIQSVEWKVGIRVCSRRVVLFGASEGICPNGIPMIGLAERIMAAYGSVLRGARKKRKEKSKGIAACNREREKKILRFLCSRQLSHFLASRFFFLLPAPFIPCLFSSLFLSLLVEQARREREDAVLFISHLSFFPFVFERAMRADEIT